MESLVCANTQSSIVSKNLELEALKHFHRDHVLLCDKLTN